MIIISWKAILTLVVILYLFFKKLRNRKTNKMLASFYTKSSLPFIGHGHLLMRRFKVNIPKFLHILKDWSVPASICIFHVPLVIVGTPKDVQTVLNTSNDRGIGLLVAFRNAFADGLILNTGEKWRKHRRLMTSVLSASMMQPYLVIFNQYAEILVQKIQTYADTDKAFNIWSYVANFNIDVIFENMADHKLQALEKENDELFQLLEKEADLDASRIFQPLVYLDFMYKLYLYITGNGKVFHKVKQFLQNITQERLDSPLMEKKRKSFLDIMLEVHITDPSFTKQCIQDEFLTIITAGSVTGTRGTSFTLLMLAMHPDAQDKAYQEINAIFGDGTKPVEITDMNKLLYLEQCIKETLRMFPPAPMTFRKHSQEIVLNDKQTIPANFNIIVSMYSVHFNEQLYPNPNTWDPDRFKKDTAGDRDRHSFIPFGVGPRSCPGAKYAMISMKTQLVYLLRNYRFTTDMKINDIELDMNAILKCENGFWVKLWRRMDQT